MERRKQEGETIMEVDKDKNKMMEEKDEELIREKKNRKRERGVENQAKMQHKRVWTRTNDLRRTGRKS